MPYKRYRVYAKALAMTGGPPVTALVLAGSRRGRGRSGRPLPAGERASAWRPPAACRCWSAWYGRWRPARGSAPSWSRRTIGALLDRLPELAALREPGRLRALASAASLSGSVAAAFALAGPPMLVTTADHALLDPAMLDHFLAAADGAAADIAVGLASAAAISAAYPETRRTYLRFRDDGYSGANLFLLRTPAAR